MKKRTQFFLILPLLIMASCGNQNINSNDKESSVTLEVPTVDLCHNVVREFLNSTDSEKQLDILKNKVGNFDYQTSPIELIDCGIQVQVYYDTDPEFSHPMFYFPDYGDYTLCVPGKTYYYKAYHFDDEMRYSLSDYAELSKLPDYEPLQEGTFKTLDSGARYVNIEKKNNIRDIGGWKTVDGRKVKYGMLYRGPEFETGSIFSKVQMHDLLGIKTEIDLRYDVASTKTESIFGANYVNCGMKQYDMIFPSHPSYSEYTKTSLQNIFDLLSKEENYPAYFHCAVGADRTGTLAFLIGGLLGVSLEDLTKDFELTSFSEMGYRCRGPLSSPYEYGKYQDDSQNYINWGALIDGIKAYNTDGQTSLKECFRKFIIGKCNISSSKIQALEDIMLEN